MEEGPKKTEPARCAVCGKTDPARGVVRILHPGDADGTPFCVDCWNRQRPAVFDPGRPPTDEERTRYSGSPGGESLVERGVFDDDASIIEQRTRYSGSPGGESLVERGVFDDDASIIEQRAAKAKAKARTETKHETGTKRRGRPPKQAARGNEDVDLSRLDPDDPDRAILEDEES